MKINRNTTINQSLQDPIKMVIFDWDGTLMDSIGQIVSCLLQTAATHKLPLTHTEAQDIIGLGLPEAMHVLFPQHRHLHTEMIQTYSQFFLQSTDNINFFTGVNSLLDTLDSLCIETAIATGKSRIGLDRVMAQTESKHRFKITRCASETASKPNPLMLEEILKETGLSATQCIMVGDSSYDLEMAQRIQMPRIAMTHGVHDAQRLAQYSPLATVDSIIELQHILTEILGNKALL